MKKFVDTFPEKEGFYLVLYKDNTIKAEQFHNCSGKIIGKSGGIQDYKPKKCKFTNSPYEIPEG